MQQHCSWLKKIAFATPGIAVSRSASANTTFGDLPPSSSVTRLRFSAVALTISFPISVEPVNATLSIPGMGRHRRACGFAEPGDDVDHAVGSPASCISSASRSALSGVCSAGLSTTVHPVASAGPSFRAAIRSGKFHGMIWPTTPIGSFKV